MALSMKGREALTPRCYRFASAEAAFFLPPFAVFFLATARPRGLALPPRAARSLARSTARLSACLRQLASIRCSVEQYLALCIPDSVRTSPPRVAAEI